MAESPSAYDPKKTEAEISALWEESGLANPDNLPDREGQKPFAVFLPLPNVTGTLHMGHALNATSSDILVRWHRMKGDATVWFPGTDHAGIATQNVVEKELRKEGVSRFDLGREKFVERVWEWKKKYSEIILGQLKTIGASCDWSRTRFTMDEAYAKDVLHAFTEYDKKGLVYRALRTVNWCPRCHTGISDLEVEYKEENATLYTIQYGPFTVATTRPETKFGDTALAVNPRDIRYAEYIGKEIEIETLDTVGDLATPKKITMKIMVVGDDAAEMGFGTGVIKVTPAHDMADYEIGRRHGLGSVQVIDSRGKMMANTGKYAGVKSAEARKKVADDLRAVGLLVKEESYHHNLAVCSRCASAIEPLPSWQWFLKMEGLAKAAKVAVEDGRVRITPDNFTKVYFAWLDGIRDWCVSRQLWWGHRIPAYFCAKDTERYVVAGAKPDVCPFCKECDMTQSEDVLDTWFSSALWPFAGLPQADIDRFYPSSVLITARDIINLWVGRMIFSGLEFKESVPFPEVFIHATVQTKDGKRMSKSLGTGVDPLGLIEKYGADATRFGIIWQAMGGQDIRFDEAAVVAGKKFANKLWNAGRFVGGKISAESARVRDVSKYTVADAAVMARLKETKTVVDEALGIYEFGQALHAAYDFFWHDVCDIYLEAAKAESGSETDAVLFVVFRDSLKILHPFMPFVTEALYRQLPGTQGEPLMIASWPE